MPKQKHWTFWPLLILATWLVLFLIYGWKNTQFMLELYAQAALTMLHGDSPEGVAAMAYPPLLVAMYIPFAEMSNLVQRISMLGVMAIFLVFIFSTIQSMVVGKHSIKKTAVYWCLVAAIVGRYVVSPIENYSHDLLIAALIILAIRCWAKQREKWGGVAIGVATACKATPLLFLPFLALHRRWKAALVMFIVMVIAFFLPNVLFPRDGGTWTEHWFSLVFNSLQITDGTNGVVHWSTWNQLNQSISGTVERLFSYPPQPNKDAVDVRIMTLSSQAIYIITNMARIGVMGVLFFALYKPSNQPLIFRRFCEGAILVCAMLLLSPMSSKAHFFLLLLPGCVMMRFWMWEKKDWILTSIFIIMFFYGTLTVKDLVGTTIGHAALATGSVTWCTLLAMLGTWRVMRLPHSSSDSSSSKKQ